MIAALGTAAQVIAIGGITLAYWRGPESGERLVTCVAAASVSVIILGKVLSPQFLMWLLPLVPLVRGRQGLIATTLLSGALALTQVEIRGFEGLTVTDWAVWTLLARNLLLASLLAVLLYEVLSSADMRNGVGIMRLARSVRRRGR